MDGPLKLDPMQSRRTVFETNHRHVGLGLIAIVNLRRRRFWDGQSVHSDWRTHGLKTISAPPDKNNHPLVKTFISTAPDSRWLLSC